MRQRVPPNYFTGIARRSLIYFPQSSLSPLLVSLFMLHCLPSPLIYFHSLSISLSLPVPLHFSKIFVSLYMSFFLLPSLISLLLPFITPFSIPSFLLSLPSSARVYRRPSSPLWCLKPITPVHVTCNIRVSNDYLPGFSSTSRSIIPTRMDRLGPDWDSHYRMKYGVPRDCPFLTQCQDQTRTLRKPSEDPGLEWTAKRNIPFGHWVLKG